MKTSPTTKPIRFLHQWGSRGSEPGQFTFPIDITINGADEVFVTDFSNSRVQKFDTQGELLAVLPVARGGGGIAVDENGKMYLTHFRAMTANEELKPDRISVWSTNGVLLREWGQSGANAGEFAFPGGIAISQNGRIYVADESNHRVQVFDHDGNFLTLWGEHGLGNGQFGGNLAPGSRVAGPQFLAIDSQGFVYTTEASVGRIQKFTPEGEFVLAWGDTEDKPGSFGGEFAAMKTTMRGPISICTDAHDCIWVSGVSGRVQQFSNTGEYLRGIGEVQGTEPGQFLVPHGLAVDSHGDFYVVDTFNHRIQKFAI
jgi:tripartite motif-containing protein 71